MPGESKQETKATSQATPYGAAQGSIDQILAKLNGQIPNADLNATESGALDTLKANATAGNPFTGKITDLATGLLNGGGAKDQAGAVSSNLGMLNDRLATTAAANYSSLDDPRLKAALDQVRSDVSGQVNGQFAAAGRDMSGMNTQTLARGVTQAQAPLILDQFNKDRALQQGAATQLFDASNTSTGLLNNMNQQDLTNRTAGIDVGSAALQARDSGANQLLNIEAQRRGIPTQNLSNLLGTIAPVGQAFATNNSTQTTTSQKPLLDTLIGGLTGGLGLLGATGGFGSGGWLFGSGKGATGLLNRSA